MKQECILELLYVAKIDFNFLFCLSSSSQYLHDLVENKSLFFSSHETLSCRATLGKKEKQTNKNCPIFTFVSGKCLM